jgi:glutamyl-tRNA reductase
MTEILKNDNHAIPDILLLGMNHTTAPVELRECIAFSTSETDRAIKTLQRHPSIREIFLVSTCNRVEFLLTSTDREIALSAVKEFISDAKGMPLSDFEKECYIHHGDEAVRHIFRVAASLDSMMLGESQILGQIKEAYLSATAGKTSGVILNRLLHRTFFVAKKVRTETGIGSRAVSISYAAIEMARKIFGTLEEIKILLIGAGEMAELAVEHLIRHRAGDIYVANRTLDRGFELAEKYNGKAIGFEEIESCISQVDIIISSTGAPGFVLTRKQVKRVLRSRRNRPIFFIDIAVPRDIDPTINGLDNSYVYDIDDLQGVINENIKDRKQEAVKGERIVDEAVFKFRRWYESLGAVPTIVDLRNKMESISKAEVQKTLQAMPHLSKEDGIAMQKMSSAMINKILHDPIIQLKSDGCHGDRSTFIDIARKLFRLDE